MQYMAEFDPEACERNRQSGLHKGEVLRPVLVAGTHSKTERQFPGNKRPPDNILSTAAALFCLDNNLFDCEETERGRRAPHSQLSCKKMKGERN